jgi:hypothetical protein
MVQRLSGIVDDRWPLSETAWYLPALNRLQTWDDIFVKETSLVAEVRRYTSAPKQGNWTAPTGDMYD